jgi:NADPH:quinone reductase-like Zn-dependent oxidoreductase
MRAVVYDRYGGPEVLRLVEVDRPTPGPGQVLVDVRAVGLNASDWETLRGRPAYSRIGGPFRPAVPTLGSDIAGVVAAVGPGVTRFAPGDRVFGDNLERKGGFAEYAIARDKVLLAIPDGLSFVDASTIPQSGVIALQGLRGRRPVRAGQRVLVNGAGGGTGSFAVRLAKLDGAEVTGVDRGDKLDFVRSLGADHVVDYTRDDYTRTGPYDVVLDLVAYRGVLAYRRALAPGGRYRFVGGSVPTLLRVLVLGRLTGRDVGVLAVRPNPADLLAVTELARPGGPLAPIVDRVYPLDQVAEALRHQGEGHARGKVVVSLE